MWEEFSRKGENDPQPLKFFSLNSLLSDLGKERTVDLERDNAFCWLLTMGEKWDPHSCMSHSPGFSQILEENTVGMG